MRATLKYDMVYHLVGSRFEYGSGHIPRTRRLNEMAATLLSVGPCFLCGGNATISLREDKQCSVPGAVVSLPERSFEPCTVLVITLFSLAAVQRITRATSHMLFVSNRGGGCMPRGTSGRERVCTYMSTPYRVFSTASSYSTHSLGVTNVAYFVAVRMVHWGRMFFRCTRVLLAVRPYGGCTT